MSAPAPGAGSGGSFPYRYAAGTDVSAADPGGSLAARAGAAAGGRPARWPLGLCPAAPEAGTS